MCQEVAVAKGNLRDMCLRWKGPTWPNVSLPHLSLDAERLQALPRVAQVGIQSSASCLHYSEQIPWTCVWSVVLCWHCPLVTEFSFVFSPSL